MYFIGYKNPKILQVFPTDIVEKPLNHLVNTFAVQPIIFLKICHHNL